MSGALLLVALPTGLLTMTENCAPLSSVAAAGVVNAGKVAPSMGAPLRIHW